MGVVTSTGLAQFLAQVDLSSFNFPGGPRAFTGFTMLVHMFFAQLFVGFAIAAPILQVWGARTGSPRMDRLAHSMARFNVLTFSTGATFAVLFLVLLVGFYPRVTTALFAHFYYLLFIAMASMLIALWGMYSYYYKWDRYSVLNKRRHALLGLTMGVFIWIWMALMSGIDTFMVTGGGPNAEPVSEGNVNSLGAAIAGIFNPMFVEEVLHRTFANLSWPAFALAAWAAFMYIRSKSEADRAFYDWSSSLGLTWGVGFLLVQPFAGFAMAYAMMNAAPANPADVPLQGYPDYDSSYGRLVGAGAGSSFTSNLFYVNLIMVVVLFVLSSIAMYMGAGRHPDSEGRRPIQIFGIIAAVAGLYSISPLAGVPVFWVRYIAMLIMVLATAAAFVAYVRGRMRFRYGSPGAAHRAVLMGLGVLAATTALSMGLMKSNSRVPYTIYNEPQYTVENEKPPSGLGQ